MLHSFCKNTKKAEKKQDNVLQSHTEFSISIRHVCVFLLGFILTVLRTMSSCGLLVFPFDDSFGFRRVRTKPVFKTEILLTNFHPILHHSRQQRRSIPRHV